MWEYIRRTLNEETIRPMSADRMKLQALDHTRKQARESEKKWRLIFFQFTKKE